jgi:hypothetical protein
MKSVIVLDGFYDFPQRVRKLALEAQYCQPDQLPPGYPGTESKFMFYSQSVVARLSQLVGKRIIVDPKQNSFGVFSKPTLTSGFQPRVHVDATEWTGIVYLNETFDENGGTELVEHKKTGLTALPEVSALADEFKRQVLEKDEMNGEAWKVHCRTASRFNRLFLFRSGRLFHRASARTIIGDEPRLTHLFFFNTEKG